MNLLPPIPFFRAALVVGSLISTSFAGSLIRGPEKPVEPIGGAFTLGYQGSEDLHTGYADVLQPLYAPSSNFAIFYDGRFAFDDDDQDLQSHGLVLRYRLPDHDIILGANVYYDSVNSTYDHHFDQLGLGVEVLTKWVDFRANYYLPDQKRERIDTRSEVVIEDVTQELRVLGVRRVAEQGGFTRLVPVVQGSVSGRFQRYDFTRFESPLEGLDTELGFLIPGLNRYAEVRVFGGYFHYLNPYGSDFDGFKARLEARIRKGLIADVEYWDNKNLNGGNWTGGVRVSLPFNLGNIFAGRNPFEGASEAFGPPSDNFGDRMTDMVIRSHRVKTTSGYVQTGVQNAKSLTVSSKDGQLTLTPNFDNNGGSISSGGLTLGGSLSLGGATLTLIGGSINATSNATNTATVPITDPRELPVPGFPTQDP